MAEQAQVISIANLSATLNVTVSEAEPPEIVMRNETETRVVTREVEARCPPGFWCSAGKKIPCSINTYNERKDADDQSFCVPCPENARTAGESSTSFFDCMCSRNFFVDSRLKGELTALLEAVRDAENLGARSKAVAELDAVAASYCAPCVIGANCSEAPRHKGPAGEGGLRRPGAAALESGRGARR